MRRENGFPKGQKKSPQGEKRKRPKPRKPGKKRPKEENGKPWQAKDLSLKETVFPAMLPPVAQGQRAQRSKQVPKPPQKVNQKFQNPQKIKNRSKTLGTVKTLFIKHHFGDFRRPFSTSKNSFSPFVTVTKPHSSSKTTSLLPQFSSPNSSHSPPSFPLAQAPIALCSRPKKNPPRPNK